jgi:PAS domain S-box-containing protein
VSARDPSPRPSADRESRPETHADGERPTKRLLNEATLRALIEQIPLTVYIDRLDEVSSNVYTSPQLESVLGYSSDEWASDPELFVKVVHPDDRERVFAEHRRTRETGDGFRMEYRMIARDGTVRWFLDEATVIPDETGEPGFHHGVLLDITERKELEHALRESEEELRRQKQHLESLLEISPTAIVTLDLDGTVASWNLAAEELFGYTRGEAVGRRLEDLVANRDDLRQEAVDFQAELERTGRFRAVTRRARKDGSLLDVEVFGVPVTAADEPTGYLVVYHDVTSVKAQEEAERRYRNLVEQLPLVTYIDEPTATASSIYVSPQVEDLLGYSPDEWLGDREFFPKVLHPDDRERVLADHEQVFAAGESSWSFEYRMVARDGRPVWVRDQAVVVRDEAGEPLYVQGFQLDITERRAVEDALRRSEERFRAMFEEAPIGIAWSPLEEDGKALPPSLRRSGGEGQYRRNRAYREMLGYTEEELEGLHFSEFTHPDDLPRELELYDDLLAGKVDRYELEKRYIARDGRIIWAHVVDSIFRDDAGTPLFGLTMVADITQRREAEEALRESEAELRRQTQYLQSLLEISPVAVATLDLQEHVTSWNPAAELLFGYSAEEAVGRPLRELILRTDALHQEGASISREALHEGSAHRITRRMRKDGTLVDVEVLVVPLDMDGERVGWYVIYHDVSALHRQKQYFESLLEVSPTAIITVDLEDNVTSWNPAAEKLFGYVADEALGRNVDQLVAASEELRADAADVNRQGSQGEIEVVTRRTRKDGSLVDVHLLVAPIVLDGELLGRYGIYHDISELQRQKRYFQSLLENSPTAIAVTDIDEHVTAWNPAAERLFGYSREEALGQKIDDLVAFHEEVRDEGAAMNRRVRSGEEAQRVTRRTRKDGSLVDVEVRVAPVRVTGEVEGFCAIYHDIGELVKARREAEEATQAKSAFLATMSHEIRTPMNAVIGMAELLLDTRLTPEQRSFADVIRTSGDSLLAIINDILDFSKIEAGRLDLEHRPFSLSECVESALEIVAASASRKGLDLASLVDPEAPGGLVGDMTRLRQILVNLLTNAVKFTESGEVVLSIDSKPASGDGGADGLYTLHFAVRDTGIGIPSDRMDRLFHSFSQVDASTTRRYGGTGLGLAISKRLSEMMGGTMWAESRPGDGSTFHFTVTMEAAPIAAPTEPRPAELVGKRLLVVDDNAANREVVRRQASSWGLVARETGSPGEALEWVRRGDPFDVAILDLQMPDVDGLTLARELRALRDAASLPLVLLTSLGRRREDFEAGVEFAAYLTKPIKSSQLYEALAGIFGRPVHDDEPSAGRADAAPAAGEPAPLRILLAEDNEVNTKLALLLLERLGYRADVVGNGREALEALRRDRYDVVLMDVEMPEMDGLEASRRIHAELPNDTRPRIIAMTANAMQGDRETCLAAGMDDYLSKPIRREELAAALTRSAALGASPPQTEDALDPAALEALEAATDDPAFVAELVETFRRDAPNLVEAMWSSSRGGDAETLRRAAHTLKSNARTFGAASLAELCEELEATAGAGVGENATELVHRIETEFARVDAALARSGVSQRG